MAQKFLFEKQAEDKRIYNLNQGYWKKKLQSRLKIKLDKESEIFKNVDARGKKIYDANPIFTFINENKTKAIRIIQDDVALLKDLSNLDNEKYLISAWLDNIIYSNNKEVPELVIALFLTKETVDKAMNLVILWLNNELTSERIDNLI
ncbi:hypothetical protein HZQ24_05605 [Elizabethkingia anophelis]|uniref:hypothetical protein n=1 Tax=Elizabethkingia miricola TaxID=172045 RepID=UPI0021A5BD79|nr:hypothetical protein [Elizabethkingia anophelis]MDV3897203.1 hypothetical protein [Elizabethkingia anophelis]